MLHRLGADDVRPVRANVRRICDCSVFVFLASKEDGLGLALGTGLCELSGGQNCVTEREDECCGER